MTVKIGVIGGGVVGLSCALRLQRAGHVVSLFEPDRSRSAASWGNAGHIAVEQVAPLASPANLRSAPSRLFVLSGALDLPLAQFRQWLPFALRMIRASTPACFGRGKVALKLLLADALPAWHRLATDINRPDLIRSDGHFIVWETPETARKGLTTWMSSDIGGATCHEASADDISRLAQLTAGNLSGVVRFAGTGQISDLNELAGALEQAFQAAGGTLVREAARIGRIDNKAFIAGHMVDLIIVSAGVASRPLMESIGHRTPMIAERGYNIRVRADRWPAEMPPVVFEDRSVIVTRYRDCVQAASFVEFGAADAPPDPRKWERLEQHVAALCLPIDGPYTRWMGSRPTFPDYLPAIGRSTRANNLYYAFGHQHLGLTLAATTAEIVTDLVAGREARIDIGAFDIRRFG